MGSDVALSTVICIHDKAECLGRVLAALTAQGPGPAVEAVLVFDACTDDSRAIAARCDLGRRMPVTLLDVRERSPGRARNRGAAAAHGRSLLFLDGDVILPPGHLAAAAAALDAEPRTVLLTPLCANGISHELLPYLADLPADWPGTPDAALLAWAAAEPALADPRATQAEAGTGRLDALPYPWVFGWSSAMALSRDAFERAGGFDARLMGRGSEDLALSRRLWKDGASFRMLGGTPAFHWPHRRDRRAEIVRDRAHERQMLAASPAPDIEALCAFDGEHANAMEALLAARLTGDAMAALAERFAEPLGPVATVPDAFDLVVGLPPGRGLRAAAFAWPAEGAGTLPLRGFALPHGDAELAHIAVAGLWELMPPALAARVLAEARRAARQVWLVRRADGRIPAPDWPAAQLSAIDRPYWEGACPPSRDLWDHPAVPAGASGPYRVYAVGG